jgi:hypothetical protein
MNSSAEGVAMHWTQRCPNPKSVQNLTWRWSLTAARNRVQRFAPATVMILVLAACGPLTSMAWSQPPAESPEATEQDRETPEAETPEAEMPDGWDRAVTILESTCWDCHGQTDPEAHLDLTHYTSLEQLVENRGVWDKVRQRVHAGDMPPEEMEPLELDDRAWFVEWIQETLRQAAYDRREHSARAPLRRLNRAQYSNTIRDLLGIHFEAGDGLPADGAGGEGFDNAAETLFLSPIHAEKYLEAAQQALEYLSRDARARRQLFVAEPSDDLSENDAAREILARFLPRAFRRAVTDEEIERLMSMYETAREEKLAFDDSLFYAITGALISPQFLFLLETPVLGENPQPVDPYALASRLSYFLWDSMPDEALFDAAADGSLLDPDVLTEQMKRMLADVKVRPMTDSFVGQWLGTRAVGREVNPDPVLFPRVIDEITAGFREEPVMLFEEILKEDRSLLELISANYTFVNDRLVRHYDLRGKIDEKGIVQQLVKRDLPEESVRGGILTMAGVLTLTSYPNRTSPVLRGNWVLEHLLGTPPPAPPPGIEPLSSDPPEELAGKSLRERLEIHRSDPTCAACHQRMDPLGFALENFDPIGQWRDTDGDHPIEAAGQLPSGQTFEGPRELKQVLLEHKELFIRNLTAKMLGYALGRGLRDTDYYYVDEIVNRLMEDEFRGQTLVKAIITSEPFRNRWDPELGEAEAVETEVENDTVENDTVESTPQENETAVANETPEANDTAENDTVENGTVDRDAVENVEHSIETSEEAD